VSKSQSECKHTRLITMGLLDTSGGGSGFASGLGGELLTRGLATGRFTCEGMMLVDEVDDL